MTRQLTLLEHAGNIVHGSGFADGGDIAYGDWCRREAERIRAKGGHAAAVKNWRGEIAVYAADTEAELARIHNGGPDGASRDATLPYLRLFREAGGAKGDEGRADGHA